MTTKQKTGLSDLEFVAKVRTGAYLLSRTDADRKLMEEACENLEAYWSEITGQPRIGQSEQPVTLAPDIDGDATSESGALFVWDGDGVLMLVEIGDLTPAGDCPDCRQFDMKQEQSYVGGRGWQWWRVCPCGHSEAMTWRGIDAWTDDEIRAALASEVGRAA